MLALLRRLPFCLRAGSATLAQWWNAWGPPVLAAEVESFRVDLVQLSLNAPLRHWPPCHLALVSQLLKQLLAWSLLMSHALRLSRLPFS